jgi:predicted dehydrogenase
MGEKFNGSTRRDFLRQSSFAAAVAAALGSDALASAKRSKSIKPSLSARSTARVVGANDRINVGMIGMGGMGTTHLRAFMLQTEEDKDIQVVAVSDLYTRHKERARDIAKLSDKDVHHDYRDLLTRDDVDAVLIAVPDHWHGQVALDALTAGKDVYLEKPMTHTIEEARLIVEAAKKYNRILQVGVQGLSSAGTQKARELIEQGEIGDLLWAQATAARNSMVGEWNYRVQPEGTPETIDWKRWLGAAPQRPFSAERYFRWRKYWDYSGGIATDLFYHSLAPLVYAMGAQFPTAVSTSGGIYVQKDREVPDTYATLIEYPNFYIDLSGSMANGAAGRNHRTAIYGHKGTILFERDQIQVVPEYLGPEAESQRREPPEPKVYDLPPVGKLRDARTPHTTNFFSCVRTRKQPNLPADLGYRVLVAINLGVQAYREGRTMLFDPKMERPVHKPVPKPAWEGDGKNHTESVVRGVSLGSSPTGGSQ